MRRAITPPVRVLHVTTVHGPLDNRINLKECVTLARAGYDVHLAAPEAPARPSPVEVTAVGRPRGRLRRIAGSTARATRVTRSQKPAVVHVHDPELLPYLAIQRILGRTTIYDAHEDLPAQIRDKHWLPPAFRPLVAAAADVAERVLTRFADHIISATPSIADRFEGRSTLVQNFPREEEFAAPGTVPHREREPLLVHVGGLTAARGALELVAAIARVDPSLDVRVAVGGSFSPDSLRHDLARVDGWNRIDDLGWLNRPDVTALLAKARAGLLLFHPLANHVESQPTKLFEYLAAGLPVIASDFPYWRSLIGNDGAVFVDPLDPSSIASGVEWVLTHPDDAEAMGERGRALVLERFVWEREGERLVEAYRALAGSGTA